MPVSHDVHDLETKLHAAVVLSNITFPNAEGVGSYDHTSGVVYHFQFEQMRSPMLSRVLVALLQPWMLYDNTRPTQSLFKGYVI